MRRRDVLVHGYRVGIGASFLTAGFKTDAPWETLIAGLENQIPGLMKETAVPGLSIAILKDARLGWHRGFGIRDAASKVPVDNATVFEAASMSKPVFAYAVMKLCEQGVLDLDTPLVRYTSVRFLEGDPRLQLITARHVLSHTSGFQNWRSEKVPLKIHFTPGEKYLYSGEGYNYLQTVVARLTGQAMEPYMKANLFDPFGMASSGYVWNDMFEKRMARPHDRGGKPLDNRKSNVADVARYGSAGALLTTPADYAAFLIQIIGPQASDTFRLTKRSLEEMLRPHSKVAVADEYSISWSLGWRLAHAKERDTLGHGGDNPGFHCLADACLKKRSGFVIMTNGDNGVELLKRLAPGIAQRLYSLPED